MDISNVTKEEIDLIKKIEKAMNEVAVEQVDLLKRGRVERTFSTCFVDKIKSNVTLENIDIDPFYNKHIDASKRLNDKLIELDIAVHQRGIDDNNLVAIEIETSNNPTRDDLWKIEGLTQELGGYGYKLGLYVVFGISKNAGEIITMEWYKDGKPL